MFTPLQGSHFAPNTCAVCIGSGRFMASHLCARAVLVPVFRQLNYGVIIAQTRGTSFASACAAAKGEYEVDTIDSNGHVLTAVYKLEAVGSLGTPKGRASFLELPSKLPQLKYVGFGVTEAGLQSNSQVIKDLAEFLLATYTSIRGNNLSLINTDNFPNNGYHIKKLVLELDWVKSDDSTAFRAYLNTMVHFHNTMVDRITNHRANDSLVPLTEPLPAKILAIEDLHGVLEAGSFHNVPGVFVRAKKSEIAKDYLLKFSLGNAVNSAMVYLLALSRQRTANQYHQFPIISEYLDLLFEKDILPTLLAGHVADQEARSFYAEWLVRMKHPFFGLDNFWVSQNALLRVHVRLLNSVNVNVVNDVKYQPSSFMAFATAVALRFLTPSQNDARHEASTIFVGQMDPINDNTPLYSITDETWNYDSGLTANVSTGKYSFDDGENGRCDVHSVQGSILPIRLLLLADSFCMGLFFVIPAQRVLAVFESYSYAQTRGTSFASACAAAKGEYEVDTIDSNGHVLTAVYKLEAVGSLGTPKGRASFLELPSKLPQLKYVGFGVTEAGLQSNSQVIKDLAEFLLATYTSIRGNNLSLINTDNFPNNGYHIKKLVLELDWVKSDDSTAFRAYLNTMVHFHNTMVDRITNHRANDSLVPLTEPLPAKILAIEDLHGVLEAGSFHNVPGVFVRAKKSEIAKDYLLKFSLGNAVNSAMVYLLALSRQRTANQYHQFPIISEYLDLLFEKDILPTLLAGHVADQEARSFYAEWLVRMKHPFFGLDNFWVSQNALLRVHVRLLNSVNVNVANDVKYQPSSFMAFATAVALRFLTPSQNDARHEASTIFVGQMDPINDNTPLYSITDETWNYDSGLTANVSTGKYSFDDGENGRVSRLLCSASQRVLSNRKSSSNQFPKSVRAKPSFEVSSEVGVAIASVLSSVKGFDLTKDVYVSFAADVAALYHRLISGKQTALETLQDILRNHSTSEYLATKEEVTTFVREAVASVQVIDVHTHLFPPSHGNLMLWGINELLTYHYLVAEFLQTSRIQVEEFNSYPKEQQAVIIWQHLFIDRSPVSEACRGVLTTLHLLGLDHLVAKRDIAAIQNWFNQQDPEEYVDTVFRLSGLKYAVMTNIPFEPKEACHWLGDPATNTPPPAWSRKYFRSALRVDQVLLGDWASIGPTLDVFKLPHTLAGVRGVLEKWIDIMKPEYFMASVPIFFEYSDENALESTSDTLPSGYELLTKVLLPLAEKKNLPIALKFDSVRPINACYGVAGDGVKPSNVDILINLCNDFPRVKFLATFLSRVNQHEVTVTANKFPNLHLYGCWWYCNNPSIIEELTRMRIEILGTAFTSQHSDARVLDQLIYKWSHSRDVIGEVLVDMYQKLFATGWKVSKSDIERDVQRCLVRAMKNSWKRIYKDGIYFAKVKVQRLI
ncbi:hypothetical protein CCR75_001438 [Bremia lactucae]|uniref:Mannitol dehydrogenase N-terminal domain-containing protein n=1 Tax=Bremia lactucae TaxID=4779 RepID=A0A976IM06_BRELC|nr:hypothetical protein CCR75_001438 [Bremia lactucae]